MHLWRRFLLCELRPLMPHFSPIPFWGNVFKIKYSGLISPLKCALTCYYNRMTPLQGIDYPGQDASAQVLIRSSRWASPRKTPRRAWLQEVRLWNAKTGTKQIPLEYYGSGASSIEEGVVYGGHAARTALHALYPRSNNQLKTSSNILQNIMTLWPRSRHIGVLIITR